MVIWEILYGNDTACRGFIAEMSYSNIWGASGNRTNNTQ